MKLMTAIKTQVSATPALSSLVGRTFTSVIGDKTKVKDGPYLRVSTPGGDNCEFGFSDTTGVTTSMPVQFSVFAVGLNNAEALIDSIIAAFLGTFPLGSALAYGTFKNRGFIHEAKNADSDQCFHSYAVISFGYDGY